MTDTHKTEGGEGEEKEEEEGEKETEKKPAAAGEEEEDVGSSGRLFVLNLPYTATEKEVRELFGKYGEVAEVHIPKNEDTTKARGFAYATYTFPEHAVTAMQKNRSVDFPGQADSSQSG
eukprot:GDKI01004840.1.p2 GENE.GDKI01004840.1~~GDKI01004840.1.p2  ORF type:complete len:133 (+),score=63.90 GDKI01004840.1:43-399(+)